MKRYKMKFGHLVEDPDGEWVKYEDAEEALDEFWWNARENEE